MSGGRGAHRALRLCASTNERRKRVHACCLCSYSHCSLLASLLLCSCAPVWFLHSLCAPCCSVLVLFVSLLSPRLVRAACCGVCLQWFGFDCRQGEVPSKSGRRRRREQESRAMQRKGDERRRRSEEKRAFTIRKSRARSENQCECEEPSAEQNKITHEERGVRQNSSAGCVCAARSKREKSRAANSLVSEGTRTHNGLLASRTEIRKSKQKAAAASETSQVSPHACLEGLMRRTKRCRADGVETKAGKRGEVINRGR